MAYEGSLLTTTPLTLVVFCSFVILCSCSCEMLSSYFSPLIISDKEHFIWLLNIHVSFGEEVFGLLYLHYLMELLYICCWTLWMGKQPWERRWTISKPFHQAENFHYLLPPSLSYFPGEAVNNRGRGCADYICQGGSNTLNWPFQRNEGILTC